MTSSPEGAAELMIRDLADLEAQPVAGVREVAGTRTDSAAAGLSRPAFSPDGQSLVFSTGALIRRAPVSGGEPLTLAERRLGQQLDLSWFGDWVVMTMDDGIWRVPAQGGDREQLPVPEPGERLASGQLLDEHGTLLYCSSTDASDAQWDTARVMLRDPDGGRHLPLEGGSNVRYVSTGHLVFARGTTLMAAPVDVRARRVTGRPTPVVEGVARSQLPRTALFAVSSSGSLVYVPGRRDSDPSRRLALVDGTGRVTPLPVTPAAYSPPRVSPDGRMVAVATTDDSRESAVWIYELGTDTPPRRLTVQGRAAAPIWNVDGRTVTFQSDHEGDAALFQQPADGSRAAERLTKAEPGTAHVPLSWTRDAKTLAVRIDCARKCRSPDRLEQRICENCATAAMSARQVNDNKGPGPFLTARFTDRNGTWWTEYGIRARSRVTRVASTVLESPFLISQDLLALAGLAVQRVAGVNLTSGRDRVGVVLTVENLTNRFYREQFQFAPARGRSVTLVVTLGAF